VLDKRKADEAAALALKKNPLSESTDRNSAASSKGLESTIREIVGQVLDEFIKNTLPGLIREELGKSGSGAGPAGIHGSLARFRIVEVMQMLAMQRQTGKLAITRAGEGADIYFREGMVVYAGENSAGKSSLETFLGKTCRVAEESLKYIQRIAEMTSQPIDSVLAQEKIVDKKTFADSLRRSAVSTAYKVMSWRDGDFCFEKASPPVFSTTLQLKVDDLIMEGTRRADEWALIQQKIPNFNAVYEAMIGNAEELTTRGMSDLDLKVFSMIDGRRPVREIMDASGLGEFEVAKSLFILLSVNLIRKKK
jgi:hypothetical protein